jgi:exosortase/archaeosortase family protein
LRKNEGVVFIVRFLAIFFVLYFLNLFIWGAIDPKGSIYYPFLVKLTKPFFDLFSGSILYTSQFILSLIGKPAQIEYAPIASGSLLHLQTGGGVRLGYACLGIGIISFWIAFVCAQQSRLKSKLTWLIIGICSIWLLNVGRVFILSVALNRRWHTISNLDHHTTFNYVAYVLIFILIGIYTYRLKKEEKLREV